MGRTIESKQSMWDGAVSEGESGLVLQPFSASRQLSTRCCARCEGLLVTEWYYDLQYSGVHNTEPLRCVQCGHRVDPVILQNQIQLAIMRHSVQQTRHRDSLKADTFAQ